MKKLLGFSSLAMGAVAALWLQYQPASAEIYQAAMWLPTTHPLSQPAYPDFAAKVKADTGGEIEFESYVGGTLLPPKESLAGIGNNVAQVGFVTGAYTPGQLPLSNMVNDVAFVLDDALAAAFASTELHLTDPDLQKEWMSNNVVIGAGFSTPIYNLICAKDIRSMADLQGKKIRTVGGAQVRWAESVGGVPVSVAASETYTGLQLGTLDCTLADATFLTGGFKLNEVAKSVTKLPLGMSVSGATWAYNYDFWKGLSPKNRRILFTNMAEALTKAEVSYMQLAEDAYGAAKDAGIEVLEPTEEMLAALKKFNEEMLADLPKVEMETRKIADPSGKVATYLALNEKWKKLLASVDRTNIEAVTQLVKTEIYDKLDENTYGSK